METTNLRVNVFELLLKYGTALFACSYALGVIKEHAFWFTMGAGSIVFPLADSGYFVEGLFVELLCLLIVVLGILTHGLIGILVLLWKGRPLPQLIHKLPKLLNIRLAKWIADFGEPLYLAIVAFSFFFWTFRFQDGFSIKAAIWLALAAAVVNLVLWLVFSDQGVYFAMPFGQQFGIATLVFVCLIAFAVGSGIAAGHRSLKKVDASARFLIAEDAVEGLKRLGVNFPDEMQGSHPQAQVTDTVDVLYEGDKQYVIRTKDDRVLQITSEKIWSVAPMSR